MDGSACLIMDPEQVCPEKGPLNPLSSWLIPINKRRGTVDDSPASFLENLTGRDAMMHTNNNVDMIRTLMA